MSDTVGEFAGPGWVGLGPRAEAASQSGMRAASNRIVPLRASTAAPSRAARRIRRQYLRLVYIPAAAHLTAPAPPQILGQGRRELGLPVPDRFIAEHDAGIANISGRSRRLSL